MKLFTILAATLTLASAGQIFNPAEINQALEYQQPQGIEQSNGWQLVDGGYQGHQIVQSIQHQPIQQQNIQTHHFELTQPQQHQYQNQPQQYQFQSQLQHVQFQSQPEHDQIQSSHIGHSNGAQFDQHRQIGQQVGQIDHSGENNRNREAKILKFQHDSDGHNYQYAYETENGIKVQEVGTSSGEGSRTQGAYSYTGDDGKIYTVTYTADENGFHPSGDHLPTPPPVPEEIARSIEHNLRDEANGIVDDGQYHHEQQNEQYTQQSYHQEQQNEQYTQQSQQHQEKQAPPEGLFQRHNNKQIQQQQPTNVVQRVEQHKQEQQQQQALRLQLPQVKQQKQLQQEAQHVIVQEVQQNNHQQNLHQQQLPKKMIQKFQRHQRPIRPQQHGSTLTPVELRHVVHMIPTFTADLRHQRPDDYVGPAPAPVPTPVSEYQR